MSSYKSPMNGLEQINGGLIGPVPKAIDGQDAAALPLDDLMITQAWADTSRLFFFEPLILDRIDEEREEDIFMLEEEERRHKKKKRKKKRSKSSGCLTNTDDTQVGFRYFSS